MYISMISLNRLALYIEKMDHSYGFYPIDSTSMKDILAAELRQFQTLEHVYMPSTIFHHN